MNCAVVFSMVFLMLALVVIIEAGSKGNSIVITENYDWKNYDWTKDHKLEDGMLLTYCHQLFRWQKVSAKAGEMKISGRDGNEKFSNIFGTGIGTGTE
jgi:hypothetical protein